MRGVELHQQVLGLQLQGDALLALGRGLRIGDRQREQGCRQKNGNADG